IQQQRVYVEKKYFDVRKDITKFVPVDKVTEKILEEPLKSKRTTDKQKSKNKSPLFMANTNFLDNKWIKLQKHKDDKVHFAKLRYSKCTDIHDKQKEEENPKKCQNLLKRKS
ncbi:hypothetical protein RFI_25871, partial [Reticulomyxa filosa]